MRIALAQIQSGTEPAANLGLVEDYTPPRRRRRRLAGAGPEATMCRLGVPLSEIAEPLDGAWATGVGDRSPNAQVSSSSPVCSSPAGSREGRARVTNTLIATGRGVDAHYDKIYLYDAFGFTKSNTVVAGPAARGDHGRRRPGTRESRPLTVL